MPRALFIERAFKTDSGICVQNKHNILSAVQSANYSQKSHTSIPLKLAILGPALSAPFPHDLRRTLPSPFYREGTGVFLAAGLHSALEATRARRGAPAPGAPGGAGLGLGRGDRSFVPESSGRSLGSFRLGEAVSDRSQCRCGRTERRGGWPTRPGPCRHLGRTSSHKGMERTEASNAKPG